ncbi:MAG: helicase HerA domain-containing protein, partial [Ktedonobacteraceae bacterium]
MKTFVPVLDVRPSRVAGERDLPALETAMQGLALDAHTPMALELAATTTSRQFLLRAEQQVALRHLEQQVQARYPQALIQPAASDPLTLASGEECSVVELRPGAAAYLPLRAWKARDLLTEGTDPLLGLLAALGSLPEGTRAVAQLALVPASPTWSAGQRRYAVEHPLEKERIYTRQRTQAPSIAQVLLLVPIVGVLLLVDLFHQLIPHWLLQAGARVLRGQAPQLTALQTIEVFVGGGGCLLLLLGGIFVTSLVVGRMSASHIYDPRLADEKTARSAYRVRLRLFVIAPGAPLVTPLRVPVVGMRKQRVQAFFAYTYRICVRIRIYLQKITKAKGVKSRVRLLFLFVCTLGSMGRRQIRQVHAHWRVYHQRSQERRARRLEREEVLRMLTAAYRQYHLAAGGYFVAHALSSRHVRTLLASPTQGWLRRTGWACDLPRSTHYLSVADLAALWHLPQTLDLPDLSYVERENARTLLAPAVLSLGHGYPLGISTHAGQSAPVFLPFSCLHHNVLIAASTGKGKSNLLEHLVRAFALARISGASEGRGGVLFVDPHGDQVEHVCGSLPERLRDEIVLIRLAERDYPIGFNPLDLSQGQDRDKIIDNLIQVVEALWPTSYGPRT